MVQGAQDFVEISRVAVDVMKMLVVLEVMESL